ncbi:MAG: DNA methyltransferase [Snowella sp.]|nr:DNA methyltransferase [Snowella sp.]
MATDPELWLHKEWLGLLQPIGLVVSPPALLKAQAMVNRGRAVELQTRLQNVISTDVLPDQRESGKVWLPNFPSFAEKVLEWLPEDLSGAPNQKPIPPELEVVLSDYGETLRPTYAVANPDSGQWLLLIQTVKAGLPLDKDDPATEKGQGWKTTFQAKFERLLRETQIPIGLLCNGLEIRLVYAPRGESSGYLTFPVQAMTEVSGRLILAALEMLIGADRLFNVPSDRRLPKILSDSRDYQAEVSTKLAGQVLDALWELLRGFQGADAAVNGALLKDLAINDPKHIYGGLITTLMRLVFLLYAEDEGLMPDDAVYQQNYAVSGLYERLREDVGNYPDTMDQRYGAWTWLLSLFRLVYDGGGATAEYLPARHGQLFDPDEYPFLEGRSRHSHYQTYGTLNAPRIADGVIYRLLDKLLMLDGERLSYRALDVEQIGSVYEAIMGYDVEMAVNPAIAVNSKPKGGKFTTAIVIDLAKLLAAKGSDRPKLLKEWAECEVTQKNLKALKEATTYEELIAALDRKVSARTPNLLPPGSLYLQPGEERRRTGSHYTPRKLTQPIVETTLQPVLAALGDQPTPEQILSLKVCDLAMGSGAFLVEACRQLADRLIVAWGQHKETLPDAVEPLLYARRLVAQRCLYGVDKNPFAVNLAKLSLWLVTLAKDRPFTFVDHALKCGDSLVGLTSAEIGSFGKDSTADLPLFKYLKEKVDRAKSYRTQIQKLDTETDQDAEEKLIQWQQAELEIEDSRLVSDVKIAAFFQGSSSKEREDKLTKNAELVRSWRKSLYTKNVEEAVNSDVSLKQIQSSLRKAEKPITPFNWEIEFPEVFDRDNPGFDAIVGNPPFAGKNTTINSNPEGYVEWLKIVHPESHGNADLVSHFFRRAFTITRQNGCFGLIATNTIAQGDTRSTGLRFICNRGGIIYNATRRYRWPGVAAVVVSVIHIYKS